IEIETTSFVGRLDIGPLRLLIRPKIADLPLARLLRYAYGLRDLSTYDAVRSPLAKGGFQDLLISMLADEIEELLARGLSRRYVGECASLMSPRGRLMVNEIARRGGVHEPALPCHYFERRTDWALNRVLLAGLELAAQLATDRYLRCRVQR